MTNAMSLLNTLANIRKLGTHMTTQRLEVLLMVAGHPGITVTEIGKALDLSASTVSREVLDLSNAKRHEGNPGLGLVTKVEGKVSLTEKGIALMGGLA